MSPLHNRTFCLYTYGCQMNEHDSERIAGMLESLGAIEVPQVEQAEIAIFVTCCVREAADVRLMGQAASIKNIPLPHGSDLPKRLICIGGCIGQRDGAALVEKLAHVDVVFGTHNIERLPLLLEDAIREGGHHVETPRRSSTFSSDLPAKRVHPWAAWLPITVGCNNYCTFCVVPRVRGKERSRRLEDVVDEARRLVDDGVREITLLGQNVNSYGRDLYGKPRFADVLRGVASTGIERIRFTTSHPKDLSDEVIALFGELDNLAPALHLPVQSGSDRILEAMNRRYTAEHYLGLVDKVRAACPDISLSTDIIVGFPGETEEDFQATYDLVKRVGYSQVFTFIYSPREGTPAAKMKDDTPREVIQKRFESLVDLVQNSAYEQNRRFVGRELEVLIEGVSKRDAGMCTGHGPHNITVHAKIPETSTIEELTGTFVTIRVNEARTWYLAGEIVGV